MVCNVKLGKNMRSVSIVGIGATPFFNGVENPQYKGLTNGELFGHAALAAMKDAGVEPRDVQYFFDITCTTSLRMRNGTFSSHTKPVSYLKVRCERKRFHFSF